ncbi:unnamed protein product [Ilex paraguariensis]|uniref:Uncharacterized protein n=1 Tax=Ilex paraguariensis TaxID=185542 RepID=A0ABC8SX00_9AQUA
MMLIFEDGGTRYHIPFCRRPVISEYIALRVFNNKSMLRINSRYHVDYELTLGEFDYKANDEKELLKVEPKLRERVLDDQKLLKIWTKHGQLDWIEEQGWEADVSLQSNVVVFGKLQTDVLVLKKRGPTMV